MSLIDINLTSTYEFIPPQGIKPNSEQRDILIKPLGNVEDNEIDIYMDYLVLIDILKRSKNPMHYEMGGFLIGYVKQQDNRLFIEITDNQLAQESQPGIDKIAFTHQTWKLIDVQMSGKFKGKQIVGWFHSHPGRGLFLSPEDNFINKHFFPYPWQVALVVDPLTKHQQFFQKKEKKMMSSGFFLYAPKEKLELFKRLLQEIRVAEKRDRSGRYKAYHIS